MAKRILAVLALLLILHPVLLGVREAGAEPAIPWGESEDVADEQMFVVQRPEVSVPQFVQRSCFVPLWQMRPVSILPLRAVLPHCQFLALRALRHRGPPAAV